jgi:drug/metabolite transporter (DMT)-like permease
VLLGTLGVLSFSVTFPATTAAETSFSPVIVGVGRSVIGAALALAVLAGRRERLLPPRALLPRLLVVGATVGMGFGILGALALRDVSSVHGAVLTGLIPAATAGMAVLRAGERPRRGYWVALGLGLVVVVGFAVIQGGGRLRAADVLLLVAVAIGGAGYAEGGAAAREYGGWRVICWALVVCLPVSLPVTLAGAALSPPRHVTAGATIALLYVGLVPMCLGFFAWYDALARGGVARIGRIQLAQPALTLGWSALLLGEQVSALTAAAAVAVIIVTAAGRNARVDRVPPSPASAEARGAPAVLAPAVAPAPSLPAGRGPAPGRLV